MEILSTATAGTWANMTGPAGGDAAEVQAAEKGRHAFGHFVTDLLLADNVVVLAGLGTSMCVKGENDRSLAPTMADLWEAARATTADFNALLAAVHYVPATSGSNLERLLSQCHLSQTLAPQEMVGRFIKDAESIIVSKCNFVTDTVPLTIHEAFLRSLARRSTRKPRLRLFTVNYDVCFEAAASRSRFVVVDGFSHTEPQQFDGDYFSYDFVRRDDDRRVPDYIANVFHLYKMHGSVDWGYEGKQVTKTRNPERPVIIYPRHTKFEESYYPPFLEMIARFQVALRLPNTGLLVLGFGFNDEHIAQPIVAAVRANVNLKALVLGTSLNEDVRSATGAMAALVRSGDHRLMLVRGRFEDFVPLLPDLVVPTDTERHYERVRDVAER